MSGTISFMIILQVVWIALNAVFNGLLIHTFEKVPGKDEVKELEIGSVKITGIEVSRHQVVSAVVTK